MSIKKNNPWKQNSKGTNSLQKLNSNDINSQMQRFEENKDLLLECLGNLSALHKVQGAVISQMQNKLK